MEESQRLAIWYICSTIQTIPLKTFSLQAQHMHEALKRRLSSLIQVYLEMDLYQNKCTSSESNSWGCKADALRTLMPALLGWL